VSAKSRIRPLERDDIRQVASLYELVMRSGSRTPSPGLADYFERTTLDYPWADPEIPSLVYEEADGEITGFIASHIRRFRLGTEPIRICCGGQLVADPRVRHKAVGALLMRRHMTGQQDMTITDTASVPTHAMWGGLHGEELSLSCINWTRLFRPWRFTGDRILPDRGARVARPLWSMLDPVTTRLPAVGSRASESGLHAEELSSEALAENVESLAPNLQLRPDYDVPFLDWLFAELAEVRSYGTLVRTLLRDADGAVVGWYVYYAVPGGTSHVLQVMAPDPRVGDVLDHLFADAQSRKSAALRGRLERRLLEALARRRTIFRYEGGALVSSQNQALLNAVAYGHSLLTRMDSEWWMGHHIEPLDSSPARKATTVALQALG
jgi:hypothetical protein